MTARRFVQEVEAEFILGGYSNRAVGTDPRILAIGRLSARIVHRRRKQLDFASQGAERLNNPTAVGVNLACLLGKLLAGDDRQGAADVGVAVAQRVGVRALAAEICLA